MEDDELIKYGIGGCRLRLTKILRSLPYDAFMISLILLYCLLIVLYFAYIDNAFSGSDPSDAYNYNIFQFLELAILLVFALDIIIHSIGYGKLYMKDCWNVVDSIIILLSMAFILMLIYIYEERVI